MAKKRKIKKRGNIFMLDMDKDGTPIRTDEFGNKEHMVEGSGGSKWIDKETGETRS